MNKAALAKSNRLPARQRILDAAVKVFGRDGLQGATTREIARVAGVNEVTLFRQFQTKENLLAAVVGQTFDAQQGHPRTALPQPSGDLRQDLTHYVRQYQAMLAENLPFIRTLIGEIHRHRPQEAKVAEGIFRPLRMELVACLRAAQVRGVIRADVSPEIVVDLLGGMVFAGVLRRCSPAKILEYTPAEYLKACVDVLVSGIEQKAQGQ